MNIMKNFKRYLFHLFVITLLFSCEGNNNGVEEQEIGQDIVENTILHYEEQAARYDKFLQRVIYSGALEINLTEINQHILGNIKYQSNAFTISEGNNIAEGIALYLIDGGRIHQSYQRGRWRDGFVTSIEMIISAQGFYIQQQGREFQGRGRTPEILVLTVENENVFIREIDILNGKIIVRNEILLLFNGTTFQHNRTRLEMYNNEIQIIYLENAPEQSWQGIFGHEAPYTFAGCLFSQMPDRVLRLTSDYLRRFAGRYTVESYKIIRSENMSIDMNLIQNRIIDITYCEERKSLSIPWNYLYSPHIFRQTDQSLIFYFIETKADDPFFWIFGEGGLGFQEIIFYFYSGGIVLIYEMMRNIFRDYVIREVERVERIQYVVFFRKEYENGQTALNKR